MEAMRGSPCFAIDASREARIEFLLRDYAYLGDDVADLQHKLGCLNRIVSKETLARWQEYAAAHELPALFTELVDQHYDPLYKRSQNSNYVRFGGAIHVRADNLSPTGISAIAEAILAKTPARADSH